MHEASKSKSLQTYTLILQSSIMVRRGDKTLSQQKYNPAIRVAAKVVAMLS